MLSLLSNDIDPSEQSMVAELIKPAEISIARLIHLTGAKSLEIRSSAERLLAEKGKNAVTAEAITVLLSPDSKDRFLAAKVLIRLGPDVAPDLEKAISREWVITNELGGYASSTILGLNTRRYHGLLVAATQPPVGRVVVLSKVEETVVVPGGRFELSANRYGGVIHPEGYRYLVQFRLEP